MTTELMTSTTPKPADPQPNDSTSRRRPNLEPSLRQILSKARTHRPGAKGALLCGGLTAILSWAAFTPLDWGWLGWVCLVPLCLLIRIEQKTRWMYRSVYAATVLQTLATLQWMRLGDPTMYPAWWALAIYWAMYVPVFLWLARVAVHRYRVPLAAAVPVVWVGLEYLRAYALTGFSWYYLGHTQYRWLELIQISDLGGAYGVSFVVALGAAVIAGLIPHSLFRRWKLVLETRLEQGAIHTPARPRAMVGVFVLVFALTLGYGYVRRAQAEFGPGPRIALIQGNFVSSVKHDPTAWQKIVRTHNDLTGVSVMYHPDLIVWPETMYRWPLTEVQPGMTDAELVDLAPPGAKVRTESWLDFWHRRDVQRELTEMSQKANAALLIGLEAHVARPSEHEKYNSALFVEPNYGIQGRYDKQHRVIFGEYIPLREAFPWLQALTPFGSGFGIAAGEAPRHFAYGGWRFSPIICFEDTVPHLVRTAALPDAEGTPVDCLVNLTNDGWFHGSSELDQHLMTSIFRAVECRKPLVRAVNTGISAFVDGDGAVLEPEVFLDWETGAPRAMRDPKSGRWTKSLDALLVQEVPLDNRGSLYLEVGDLFAGGCGSLSLLVLLGGLWPRRRPDRVTPAQNPS